MRRPVLRTCVGCRSVRDQQALIRLVLDPAEGLVISPRGAPRPPGRGAYLCPSRDCFDKAWQRKVFPRAFRADLPGLDEVKLRTRFEAELRRGPLAG